MDCPKFTPNIFNQTKCSQCFKIKEEHYNYRSGLTSSSSSSGGNILKNSPGNRTSVSNSYVNSSDEVDSGQVSGDRDRCEERGLLKCGHLFIAPLDYLPDDLHFKNKRWQRRWFILYDNGELTYSIDEHPDAIPQGTLNLNDVTEILAGEEVIGHQYSIILKVMDSCIHYVKGSTVDEYKKWIRLFTKYCSNTVPVTLGNSPVRRSSSSCTSTTSVNNNALEEQSQEIYVTKVLSKVTEGKVPVLLPHRRNNMTTNYEKIVALPQVKSSSSSSSSNRTTINNSEIYHNSGQVSSGTSQIPCKVGNTTVTTVPSASTSTTSNNTNSTTHLLRGDPDGGEQILTLDSGKMSSSNWLVTESNNSSNGNPNTDDITGKLKTLKSHLVTKKSELEKLNKDTILKNYKLLIDNLKLQLNSYFIEIDKLSYLINYKYNDLKELSKMKEVEITELKKQLDEEVVISTNNDLLLDENKLLIERINDLTEKYYNLDKSYKLIKTKLHKYRSNSLKDKDLVENEIYTKIKQLESKINHYLPSTDGNNSVTSSTPDEKRSLINVILKLNELDKRLDASGPTEWYKCTNCDYLQTEINHRDCKLNELETMVTNLESSVTYVNNVKMKYNQEIQELRSFCTESVDHLDIAYKRLVEELEEKHRIQIQQFEFNKEKELDDETRATKNALELLKKNYEIELENELTQIRHDFLIKYNSNSVNMEEIHLQHEDDTNQLRNQLVELTDKYMQKCLEYCQLEEKLRSS